MKALISLTLVAMFSLPVAAPVQALTHGTSLIDASQSDVAERRSNRCKRAYREGSICGGV